MSFAVSVDLDVNYLSRVLAQARPHIIDSELTTSIGLALKKRNETRHLAETAPDGTKWTPLKPRTIAKKTNPRMLVEHGDMLRLYSHPTYNSVTVGTADKKAYWHHAGTVWKPKAADVESGKKNYLEHTTKHLPARPLVGFPDTDRQFVNDLIEDHLKAIFNHLR